MKTKKPKSENKKGSKRAEATLKRIVPFDEWIKTPRTELQIELYHKMKKELESMQ